MNIRVKSILLVFICVTNTLSAAGEVRVSQSAQLLKVFFAGDQECFSRLPRLLPTSTDGHEVYQAPCQVVLNVLQEMDAAILACDFQEESAVLVLAGVYETLSEFRDVLLQKFKVEHNVGGPFGGGTDHQTIYSSDLHALDQMRFQYPATSICKVLADRISALFVAVYAVGERPQIAEGFMDKFYSMRNEFTERKAQIAHPCTVTDNPRVRAFARSFPSPTPVAPDLATRTLTLLSDGLGWVRGRLGY